MISRVTCLLVAASSTALVLSAIAACEGPFHGTVADASATGDLIPPNQPDEGVYLDTLSGRVAFRLRGCSNPAEEGCHAHDAGGMTLLGIPDQDLAQIILVHSSERPDLFRIAPNDVDHSWLYLKVSDAIDAGVETAMPKGSEGDPAFAATVKAWILAGAPNDYTIDATPSDAPDADVDAASD